MLKNKRRNTQQENQMKEDIFKSVTQNVTWYTVDSSVNQL